MVELSPNWMQELCYPAQYDRLLLNGLVCGEGVADVLAGELLVTTGGAGLNLSVAQGGAFVEGDDDDRGMYFVYNDASVTVTASAADPTNPRIDTVVARVYDSTYGEGADEWVLEILAGTPTGGATLTNLNGAASVTGLNALVLAYVLVPATFVGPFVNATHILDARAQFTSCGQVSNPRVDLVASAATSVTHNTATKVTVATTNHLDDEAFSVSSSVVTILQTGRYDIQGQATYGTSAQGATLQFYIGKNGLSDATIASGKVFPGMTEFGCSLAALGVALTAGTTIQLAAFQIQSSGSAAVSTRHDAVYLSRLFIRKVG